MVKQTHGGMFGRGEPMNQDVEITGIYIKLQKVEVKF